MDAPVISLGPWLATLDPPSPLLARALLLPEGVPEDEIPVRVVVRGAAALIMCWPKSNDFPRVSGSWRFPQSIDKYAGQVYDRLIPKFREAGVSLAEAERAMVTAYLWAIDQLVTAQEVEEARPFSAPQPEGS